MSYVSNWLRAYSVLPWAKPDLDPERSYCACLGESVKIYYVAKYISVNDEQVRILKSKFEAQPTGSPVASK